jgi:hypothetical protein
MWNKVGDEGVCDPREGRRSLTTLSTNGKTLFGVVRTIRLAGVLSVPMLIDRVGNFYQPGPIFNTHQHLRSRKELNSVGRRISEWFKQAGRNQDSNIMQLTIEQPRSLFDRQTGGGLPDLL